MMWQVAEGIIIALGAISTGALGIVILLDVGGKADGRIGAILFFGSLAFIIWMFYAH